MAIDEIERLNVELTKLDLKLGELIKEMPEVRKANERITWMYEKLSAQGLLPTKVKVGGELKDKIEKLKNKQVGQYEKISTGLETNPEPTNASAVADCSGN